MMLKLVEFTGLYTMGV